MFQYCFFLYFSNSIEFLTKNIPCCQLIQFHILLLHSVYSEKADIAPLLDVEDMLETRRPDWKCVFTYVQSIYRRFKDDD